MERIAEMVPRDPGEVLMQSKAARTYLTRADFEQRGLSEGCPGCWYLRTGLGRETQCEPHDCLRLTKESIAHWHTQWRGTQPRILE